MCSYHQTIKDKIKDLVETRKVDESLIKHYIFILEHFDDIITKHDIEIAKIDEQKAEIIKQFIEAPELLINLNKHLAEMTKRIGDVKDAASGKKQKIKRLNSLRERYAKLEELLKQQCEAEGTDAEEMINEEQENAAKESTKSSVEPL